MPGRGGLDHPVARVAAEEPGRLSPVGDSGRCGGARGAAGARRRRGRRVRQSVMVCGEHRNRGVGAALMDAILAEARVRGLGHVTVHSGRRAVDFYLRNGFSQHRQALIWEPGE
ncbi:GNAT family N-acetyltransferase [Actinoplanes sp. NPDC049316]|uniref:GNAT family N-acetyltransferase n=1 Tax=Actinoplanes sp. NPDC049316 TaxID=3154727 RepID=UPI003414EC8D